MNLFEYCEKYKISLAKARKQLKDGVLRLDETTSGESANIRHWLTRGQPLTVQMLCHLIDNPSEVLDLGRYADKAQDQIDALGKVQAAPLEVAAAIADTARGKPEATAILLEWLNATIPAKGCTHAYLAVRLLLGLPAAQRKFDAPRIPRAFLECRRNPEFAGWYETRRNGAKNFTIYKRAKIALVDFDL
jgi:hypothetical protein